MPQVQVELAKTAELRLCEQHRKPPKRRPPGTALLVTVASRKVLQFFDETVDISLNTIPQSLQLFEAGSPAKSGEFGRHPAVPRGDDALWSGLKRYRIALFDGAIIGPQHN